MAESAAEKNAPPPITPPGLHVIAHVQWEREGSQTFATRRAHLLEEMMRLLAWMNTDAKLPILLSGQTVILEDIAGVRPDLLALLVIYNVGGRLGIGPWYVQVDEALVSGEALIRNLLLARADAKRYGLSLMPVGYIPNVQGHVSQLPQILQGFDMDAAFLCHGAPVSHLPFRWEGPDGSVILVVNHDTCTSKEAITEEQVLTVLEGQQRVSPTSPFLWMAEATINPDDMRAFLSQVVPVPLMQSSIQRYVADLREETPDPLRPMLRGELRLQGLREHSYLLSGTLSTRLHLKQANARLENHLTYAADPWLALALTHGDVPYPDNLRALLTHSWRLLLQNQARNTLAGCSHDSASQASEMRHYESLTTANQVIARSLMALDGEPLGDQCVADNQHKISLVVWNPHNWPVEQVVETALCVPVGLYLADMADPDGNEITFSWEEMVSPEAAYSGARYGWLTFRGAAPPVGYAVYSIYLSDEPDYVSPVRSAANSITGIPDPITVAVENGQLVTKITESPVYSPDGQLIRPATENLLIGDVLRFFDGGDAGDTYNYSPPKRDAIVQADLSPEVAMESTAIYQRLILSHRLRIAPSLNAKQERTRGVRLIEMTTTATLYDYMPGIYFRTTFQNTAHDHRLRAHLRTGITSDTVLADSPFDLVARKVRVPGAGYVPDRPNMEAITSMHPMRSLCAVQDDETAMALMTRGLPEFEAIPEDGQITLALTLLRAVGWLSRGDLQTRTASVAPTVALSGAQCRRTMTADYALIPTWANDPTLLHISREYTAPLQAYQYREPPEKTRYSYLSIEGEGVLLTALKPPQAGHGLIVRLHNPMQQTIPVQLRPQGRLRGAELVNLAEESERDLLISQNQVLVEIAPHQILTLRLRFN